MRDRTASDPQKTCAIDPEKFSSRTNGRRNPRGPVIPGTCGKQPSKRIIYGGDNEGGWSLTSLLSTNTAISETKGQGWRVILLPSEGRLAIY